MVLDTVAHAVSTSFAGNDTWKMVDYFATSCPHCQHIKPEWDAASSAWNSQHMGANVQWNAKECLNEKWQPGPAIDECRAAGIQGFPTVRLLHYVDGKVTGEPIDYMGNRTSDDMIKFVKDNMGAANLTGEKEAAMPLFFAALPDSTGNHLKVPRCRRDFM